MASRITSSVVCVATDVVCVPSDVPEERREWPLDTEEVGLVVVGDGDYGYQ